MQNGVPSIYDTKFFFVMIADTMLSGTVNEVNCSAGMHNVGATRITSAVWTNSFSSSIILIVFLVLNLTANESTSVEYDISNMKMLKHKEILIFISP